MLRPYALGLACKDRAPPAIERCPREVVLIHHGPGERLRRLLIRGGRDGHEGDERLERAECAAQELGARPRAVHRAAVEPAAARVEPEQTLAAGAGGVELFSPLQAQVVEQRGDDTRT